MSEHEWPTGVVDLTRDIVSYLPEDEAKIERAVDLAVTAHAGQWRKSGELFVLHPLQVALVLAEEGLSCDTIVAGILHDVLEDTALDGAVISEQFGDEVLALVQGVTKITALAPRGTPKREKLASYRKMLVAAAEDARVLVIKLADRLHNIRTIAAMPPQRAQAIARETLEIYAPLAHRLGMGRIKTELEDRSLSVIDPRGYEEARLAQEEKARSGQRQFGSLITELDGHLKQAGIAAVIKTRIKSVHSIYEKLKRSDEVLDVLGMRIILESVDDCYRVLGIVHHLWPPRSGQFDDYIAVPRSNLYQSLHTTVITRSADALEIQIRTAEMDKIAEHGIAAHWLYKETLRGGGPEPTRTFIDDVARGQNEAADDLEEAFEAIKRDFFADEIYLFTPQGDIRILPQGACAVDFAYAVHSDLGDRTTGARVDGQIQPLLRPLRSGQVVEIITGPRAAPSRDWLDHVKTSKARSKIRHFHQAAIDRERSARGLRTLTASLRRAGLAPVGTGDQLSGALRELGYDSIEEAALEADRDESRARNIVKRLIRQLSRRPEEPPAEPRRARRRLRPDNQVGIVVDGLDGVDVALARCCAPEPGDKITGYVSMARGVKIHRLGCREIEQLRKSRADRFVKVSWGNQTQSFRCEIDLVFLDAPMLLVRIAEKVYENGAELLEFSLRVDGKVARGNLVCLVQGAGQAEGIRLAVAKLEGALKVGRSL